MSHLKKWRPPPRFARYDKNITRPFHLFNCFAISFLALNYYGILTFTEFKGYIQQYILKTLMYFATTAVKLLASIPQRHSHAVFPPFIAFYLISAGSWENSNRFFDSLFVEGDELKILKTIPFHKDFRVSVSKMEVVSSLMQSVILRRIITGITVPFLLMMLTALHTVTFSHNITTIVE